MIVMFPPKKDANELVRQACQHNEASSITEARELFKSFLECMGESLEEYTSFGLYSALGALWEAGKIQGIKDERKRRRAGSRKGGNTPNSGLPA